uniref:TF-B3 domain-containing protein n=1 Tax=Salix viminalis TaxID=40686 RepID=A0A6N2MSX2_SALVM
MRWQQRRVEATLLDNSYTHKLICLMRFDLGETYTAIYFHPMFAEEEERKMVKMVVINSRINFDHPYYDDVDEYYLGLCNEAEYEKEASNPREKEFGDSFKLLTIAERHQFLKTQTSRVIVPKKRRGSGGLGFTSMKTQCSTDQKAKSNTGSIDESGSPLGAILVPEKRRESRRKFVRKNNHCIMSTDQEDHDLTAKMKSDREKKTAGRKRVLKSQRVDVDDDRRQRSSKKMKKMGGRVDFKKLGLYPPPDLSSDIKSVMNHQEGRDSEIKLRIMKQMFKTDMDKHQERFSMPLNQIKDGHDFLNETEMEEVRHGESMSTEVKLVELRLKEGNVHQSTMKLRRRQMKNTVSYVLTSNWNHVLDRNAGALKVDDIVQVYSFRRDQKLWLVLIKVMDAE